MTHTQVLCVNRPRVPSHTFCLAVHSIIRLINILGNLDRALDTPHPKIMRSFSCLLTSDNMERRILFVSSVEEHCSSFFGDVFEDGVCGLLGSTIGDVFEDELLEGLDSVWLCK